MRLFTASIERFIAAANLARSSTGIDTTFPSNAAARFSRVLIATSTSVQWRKLRETRGVQVESAVIYVSQSNFDENLVMLFKPGASLRRLTSASSADFAPPGGGVAIAVAPTPPIIPPAAGGSCDLGCAIWELGSLASASRILALSSQPKCRDAGC